MAKPIPNQLKQQIDQQIINKTQPYSIDHTEVGARMKDIVDLATSLQFATSAAREAYLTDPAKQAFQLADDMEDGNKYYISKDGLKWVLLATDKPKEEVITFENQDKVLIAWDENRKTKFGSSANFIIDLLEEDGKVRRQYGLEVLSDEIADPKSYTIDLGGGLRTGRITIR